MHGALLGFRSPLKRGDEYCHRPFNRGLLYALQSPCRVGPNRKVGAVAAFVGGNLKPYRRPGSP